MGVDTIGISTVRAADAAIDEVIRLAKDVGIPDNFASVQPYPKSRIGEGWYAKRPTEIRSDDAELQKMAQHMMDDVCTPGNARTLTLEDAYKILRDCIYDPMARKTATGYGYFTERHVGSR
jgi:methanol:N,N-dimethyl-4-nitrosoaniline oxidoreductase